MESTQESLFSGGEFTKIERSKPHEKRSAQFGQPCEIEGFKTANESDRSRASPQIEKVFIPKTVEIAY